MSWQQNLVKKEEDFDEMKEEKPDDFLNESTNYKFSDLKATDEKPVQVKQEIEAVMVKESPISASASENNGEEELVTEETKAIEVKENPETATDAEESELNEMLLLRTHYWILNKIAEDLMKDLDVKKTELNVLHGCFNDIQESYVQYKMETTQKLLQNNETIAVLETQKQEEIEMNARLKQDLENEINKSSFLSGHVQHLQVQMEHMHSFHLQMHHGACSEIQNMRIKVAQEAMAKGRSEQEIRRCRREVLKFRSELRNAELTIAALRRQIAQLMVPGNQPS